MSIFARCVLWTGILLTISKTTAPHCDQPFQIQKGNLNKRLLGYKLFERTVVGHHFCAYECMFLGVCKSINFIGGNKTCEFNSEGSDTGDPLNFEESRGTIFSDITDWPRSMASGCAYHKCEQKQRCFPLGSNEHICVDITCDEPRNLQYGVVKSGSNIAGSVRMYVFTCPQDTFSSGDTRITCLLSGEWTSLAASCKVSTIGNNCGSIADCNETGAECIEGKCFCGGLYRYDTDVKDCVKVCTGMTNTFTTYIGTRIIDHNDRGWSIKISYTKCLQLCIDDANCLSFEYQKSKEMCQRGSVTKEMIEDALPDAIAHNWRNMHLYTRDCW